jgi:hypothetical protein
MKIFWNNLKNNRVAQAGLVLIAISFIQRYPWLLSWLGDDIAKPLQETFYTIKMFALGIILMFIKQFNITGGTKTIDK